MKDSIGLSLGHADSRILDGFFVFHDHGLDVDEETTLFGKEVFQIYNFDKWL